MYDVIKSNHNQEVFKEYSAKDDLIFKEKKSFKFILAKVDEIEDRKYVILIADDITKLKKLEQESAKIRSMFFSSVAHELRTPLNSIIPMSKSLKKYISSP